MDIMHPKAAIGTNAWGGRIYGGLIRGDYVEDEVIGQMIEESVKLDIPLFDLARDYGFGKAQKMMGRLGNKDTLISAKIYTLYPLQEGVRQEVAGKGSSGLRKILRGYLLAPSSHGS